jgi:hypothetical protein
MAAPLSRFLSQRDYLLDSPGERLESNEPPEDIENLWLSTRVLVGLRGLLPVSAVPPTLTLSELTGRLTPLKLEHLEHQAQRILEVVSSAIRGRDAFFPPCTPVSREVINLVTDAIEQETTLEISYQSLADYQPRPRCVSPLRLEQKGSLYYLHAYCYRAERNLTFRLDRVHALQPGDSADLNDFD